MPVTQQTVEAFEAMLPAIQRAALYGFRRAPRWRREELVQDAVARAYEAFVNLVARGKAALAYPSVLASYAIRQVREGRRVGAKQNVQDAMSEVAHRKKGFSLQQLSSNDARGGWEELTQDRKANPADIAACRVDFRDWLGRLERFKRRVALRLAAGDSTGDAARHFRLSPGRVSQLRRELRQDWDEFHLVPGAA
jgi:hypothetical protein